MTYKHSLRDVIDCCVWPNDGPRIAPPKAEGVAQQAPVTRAKTGAPVVDRDTLEKRILKLLHDGAMTAFEISMHLGEVKTTVAGRLSLMESNSTLEIVELAERPWRYRIARKAANDDVTREAAE